MTPNYLGPLHHNIKLASRPFSGFDSSRLRHGILPIVAFDPGGTTGWSVMVLPSTIHGEDILSYKLDTILQNKISWLHGELPTLGNEDEAARRMARMCTDYPEAAVVVEDFILRAERKEKSRELLSPVRLTAKLETYLWRENRKMHLQSAGQAKTTVTNARLEVWNCLAHDGVTDHARDADRHALLFLRRCLGPQGVSVKRAAWPHVYCGFKPEPLEDMETG